MTVREIIDLLEEFDAGTEVLIGVNEGSEMIIGDVIADEAGNAVIY